MLSLWNPKNRAEGKSQENGPPTSSRRGPTFWGPSRTEISSFLLWIPFFSGRALVSSFPTKRFFLFSYFTALTIIGHPTAHTIDDESMILLLFFVLLRSSFCCSFDDYPRKLGSRHSLAHPTNIRAAAAVPRFTFSRVFFFCTFLLHKSHTISAKFELKIP